MRRTSAKRNRENAERRKVVRALIDERGALCEARVIEPFGAAPYRLPPGLIEVHPGDTAVCRYHAADPHEKVRRSQGGSITDPANILLVCRECHNWIHANPAEAFRLGLLESASMTRGD